MASSNSAMGTSSATGTSSSWTPPPPAFSFSCLSLAAVAVAAATSGAPDASSAPGCGGSVHGGGSGGWAGSWEVLRYTVTRSEGQEGGGGIGVASVALAHPCMAPSLLPAWGGGQRGDRWDGGVGESERSDRDIRHQGRKEGSQTMNPPKGQRQGQGGWVQETDRDGAEGPMEWECTPDSALPLALGGASACLHPGTLTALFPTTRAFPPTPHPVFLAHTPHFLGARAPPPLQTCSAHPAAAGRAHS